MKKILSVLCACSVLLLSGCSQNEEIIMNDDSALPSAEAETVFRMYYPTEVNTLNYLSTNAYNETYLSANTIDCLVEYDCYGNVIPCLAESWEHNENMTEWTFHIRQGVDWVDYQGNVYDEVTADDWVASAEYVNNAKHESDCQYMYTSGSIVRNAQAYYDYTEWYYSDDNPKGNGSSDGKQDEVAEKSTMPEVLPSDIGVTAVDDYTLVYELEQPCPFFLSVLNYSSYMPVNRNFLEETGDMFGRDNKNLLYNGSFILSSWIPQEKQILTKNPTYWDAGNVYLDRVEREYNIDAYEMQGDMFLSGRIDFAEVSAEQLESWMSNPQIENQVHPDRPDNSYSYFYTFNFDPQFDDIYEPENWKLAVNNENFRQSLVHAINKKELLSLYNPYHTEYLLNDTVTPREFAFAGGKDYTIYDALKDIHDNHNPEQAVAYRDKAIEELTQAGASFPIKVLMPYNPSGLNWRAESLAVEQQIEDTLGTDFIDIIVEAGPENGFLSSVRRSGKYAFMRCNWGADYADPQTYTEPFQAGHDYIFWDLSENPDTQALFQEWSKKAEQAISVYDDDQKRFTLFAEAERLLIEHAIVSPYSIETEGYIISKLNPFETEYASIGIIMQKLKFCKLYDKSFNMEEYEQAYQEWQKQREENLKS